MSTLYDYDYIVIGSGFGGSVAALRLAEKGYTVGVMEKGKRFRPSDFPESNLQLRKYLWMPRLRLHGILQITWLKHLMVLHGAGVGGGSLVYAMTHPVPPDVVFRDPRWPSDEDWKAKLDAALRARAVHARPREGSPHVCRGGDAPSGGRRGDGRRSQHRAARRGRLLWRAGEDGAGPLLRGGGAGADGLHGVRRLHERVPPRRQELARPQLPAHGRESGLRGASRDGGDRRPPHSRRRLRGPHEKLDGTAPQAAPHLPFSRRRLLGQRTRHRPAHARVQGKGQPSESQRPARKLRTHQQRGAVGSAISRSRCRSQPRNRHHSGRTPRQEYPCRDCSVRQAPGLLRADVHSADRRGRAMAALAFAGSATCCITRSSFSAPVGSGVLDSGPWLWPSCRLSTTT